MFRKIVKFDIHVSKTQKEVKCSCWARKTQKRYCPIRNTNTYPTTNINSNKVQWKNKSIFFELPYWQYLLIRHNLDLMHIEKNVCENILGTLLNIPGKTNDGIKARKDLQILNIRRKQHPYING